MSCNTAGFNRVRQQIRTWDVLGISFDYNQVMLPSKILHEQLAIQDRLTHPTTQHSQF